MITVKGLGGTVGKVEESKVAGLVEAYGSKFKKIGNYYLFTDKAGYEAEVAAGVIVLRGEAVATQDNSASKTITLEYQGVEAQHTVTADNFAEIKAEYEWINLQGGKVESFTQLVGGAVYIKTKATNSNK